jgi:hypothetical protein
MNPPRWSSAASSGSPLSRKHGTVDHDNDAHRMLHKRSSRPPHRYPRRLRTRDKHTAKGDIRLGNKFRAHKIATHRLRAWTSNHLSSLPARFSPQALPRPMNASDPCRSCANRPAMPRAQRSAARGAAHLVLLAGAGEPPHQFLDPHLGRE